MGIRTYVAKLALAIAALLIAGAAAADNYPNKPIRIIVPFPPGGALDIIARSVGKSMSEQMNNPVVVENRPGANGNLGTDLVAKAPADGYTLLLAANGLATSPTLYKDLPYNTLRDLAPVAFVGYGPLVLVVPFSSPVNSLQDMIATARAKPDSLTYGSAGTGSSGHLASELFKVTAKINALHVAYKGGAPALLDLIGERLSFMLINPVEAVPHVKSQRLRVLAVASERRIATLPEVPTFAEAGVPGFEARNWWGFMLPAKTPKEITTRLSDEVLKALADAGVRGRLTEMGAVVDPLPADRFGDYIRMETAKWADLIKTVGIRAD
jgi:tripartite-type tricarboxylate transporter receptor subunit TctC